MNTVDKIKNGGFNILRSSVPLIVVLFIVSSFATYIWSEQRDGFKENLKELSLYTTSLNETKVNRKELKELINRKADRETVDIQYAHICQVLGEIKEQVINNARERNIELRRLSDRVDDIIKKEW